MLSRSGFIRALIRTHRPSWPVGTHYGTGNKERDVRRKRRSNGNEALFGNLSYNVTEPELKDVFGENGRNVKEVKVVLDRDTGRPRGFAFVEMTTERGAAQAIETLNGREVQGRPINVSEAREARPA